MEIMEVRLRIEPQLAQLAAMRAKPAEIQKMREVAQKIIESSDADARELWDGALHRTIAQSAGNQLFLIAVEDCMPGAVDNYVLLVTQAKRGISADKTSIVITSVITSICLTENIWSAETCNRFSLQAR